jgi:hypothetical protein
VTTWPIRHWLNTSIAAVTYGRAATPLEPDPANPGQAVDFAQRMLEALNLLGPLRRDAEQVACAVSGGKSAFDLPAAALGDLQQDLGGAKTQVDGGRIMTFRIIGQVLVLVLVETSDQIDGMVNSIRTIADQTMVSVVPTLARSACSSITTLKRRSPL